MDFWTLDLDFFGLHVRPLMWIQTMVHSQHHQKHEEGSISYRVQRLASISFWGYHVLAYPFLGYTCLNRWYFLNYRHSPCLYRKNMIFCWMLVIWMQCGGAW